MSNAVEVTKLNLKKFYEIFFVAVLFISQFACNLSEAQTNKTQISPTPSPKIIAQTFAYPIGKTETITQAKDKKDEWYNAQDFGANNHLGED